ncbi:MAG: glycerophosphodiester phosphodiesterase family protein [Candidatus Kariarchaeaceae archaeon]|jgi:glycerophosphoryl diester phosphodiesterase
MKMGKFSLFILYTITTLELLYLELLLIFLEPYWSYINNALSFLFGEGVEYGFVLILFVLVPLIYTSYLLFRFVAAILHNQEISFHLINKILPVLILIIFTGFLQFFYMQFGDEISIAYRSFENYGFIFYITLSLSVLSFFIRRMLPTLHKLSDMNYSAAILIVMFIIGIILPFVFMPPNVLDGDLPEKPLVIAHRGGGFYAPENTIEAMQLSVDEGLTCVEIDVQVSYDGVIFLLHDDTLKRTTDVEDVFSARSEDDASSFNMSELILLDAGSWYAEDDPYRMKKKGHISSNQLESYRGISVPTFEQALNFSRDNDLMLDVDLKEPDEDHPFYDQYFDLILQAINDSGIRFSQFIIFSEYETNLADAENLSSDIITTIDLKKSTPSSSSIKNMNIDGASFHHSVSDEVVQSYLNDELDVNIYTVISTIRFSQLWAQGVQYVISDRSIELHNMTDPIWSMQQTTYVILWSIFFIAELLVVVIFAIKNRKNSLS